MSKLEEKTKRFIDAIYPTGTEMTKVIDGVKFTEYGRFPDINRLPEARRDFIEELTFASESELRNLVGQFWDEPYYMLPVWAQNLAHRLLCLRCPNDPETLESAAADLLAHGPTWDTEAETLQERAKQIRSVSR